MRGEMGGAMLAVMQEFAKGGRSAKRRRRDKAEWIEEVGRLRRSGLSTVEYARKHDLHPGTLGVWASRLRGAVVSAPRRRIGEGASFVPVRVIGSQPLAAGATGEVEFVLLNGRRVRVIGQAPLDFVARILEIAEQGGRC